MSRRGTTGRSIAAITWLAIVLASEDDCMGWHQSGVVAVCAWEAELWWEEAYPAFVEDHRRISEFLGVEYESNDAGAR